MKNKATRLRYSIAFFSIIFILYLSNSDTSALLQSNIFKYILTFLVMFILFTINFSTFKQQKKNATKREEQYMTFAERKSYHAKRRMSHSVNKDIVENENIEAFFAKRPEKKLRFCRKCGEGTMENNTFCERCGEKIEENM